MKPKMDDRFNTIDDIRSLEDFEKMTQVEKQVNKEEVKPQPNIVSNKRINQMNVSNQEGVSKNSSANNNIVENQKPNNSEVNMKQQSNINNNVNYNVQNNATSNLNNYNAQNNATSNMNVYNGQSPMGRNVNNQQNNSFPLITLEGVGLAYDREKILSAVSLTINKGDFVYLVGESGAGKSSIIKMLYREIKATKGQIIIDKQDIVKLSSSKLPKLRRKIGVIFQDYKLLPDKTIYKNVSFSLEVTGYPRKKIKPKVMEVLKKVGIANQAYKYPDELSGGQQQRAAIARAIVDDPIIIVADEPTGNLDPENALSIMEILEQINEEGTTIVMATHDVGIVNNFPKRVILLGKGKVLKESLGEYIYE